MRILPILAATTMLFAAAASAQTTTASTDKSTPKQARSPNTPRNAAGQNRQLDQIGNKLLKETPKAAPGTTEATGGGLQPPK